MAVVFNQELGITNFFNNSSSIEIFNNGNSQIYNSDTKIYAEVLDKFSSAIYNSYEMPAFAVSLHKETINSLKNGIWIKFNFDKQQVHNDMPFDALLVNIQKDNCGLNNIRGCNEEYTGRCFYLNLENSNLNELFDFLDKQK